jgi:hypothetical protein
VKYATAFCVLAAALLAVACPSPAPVPPEPPTPPPVEYDAGALEEQACSTANAVCGTDYQECVRQLVRLRHSYYAELSDDDLRCWVNATTQTAMRACGNGSCQ